MTTRAYSFAGLKAACGLAVLLFALTGCHEKTAATKPSTQPQGASEEHFGAEGFVKPVAFIPAATPAPKPAQTLDKTATCITPECHAILATSKHIHGPVSEKSCYSCHNEDIGGHKFPLKRTGNETCTFCHAVSGTMSHQHKALDQGCTSCHRPHESNTKFLLKADSVERLCASCHNVPLKKHAHEPFAKGDCTSCHLSHQANNKMLLRGGEGSQHCFTCHKNVQQKLQTVSNVHKPARTDCVSCHSPHSTEFEHQLKVAQADNCYSCHRGMKSVIKQMPVKHGALTTADGCSNCHDPHGSNEKKLLLARTDTTCLKCHDKQMSTPDGRTIANMKPVLTASKFLHGPNKAGNCSGCHDPHASKEPQLLARAFPKTFYTSFSIEKYELCFTCHEKALVLNEKTTALTGFRDGDANLHFIHVNRDSKGRSCKSCHNVHGSDLPNHLASEVPFEGSTWAMPMQFEKTTDGGKCTSGCHKERAYNRSKPTTRPVPAPPGGVS